MAQRTATKRTITLMAGLNMLQRRDARSFIFACCATFLIFSGCTIQKPYLTDSERTALGRIAFVKKPEFMETRFSIPSNLISGIAEGACTGCALGLYPLCLVGGPFFVTPYMVAYYGSCAREFRDIPDPKNEFEQELPPQQFMEEVSETLQKGMQAATGKKIMMIRNPLLKTHHKVYDTSSAGVSNIDTIIQFTKLSLKLDEGIGDIGNCFFFMEVDAQWVVIHARDGSVIAAMHEEFSEILDSKVNVRDLYKDNLAFGKKMASTLADRLAAHIVLSLRTD